MFVVAEKLFGPIDISFENSRCKLDMKNCEKASNFNIRELCKRMTDPLSIYSSIFKNIQPPLKCPIEPGNYTIKSAEINFETLAFLPIDGYVYMTNVKMISSINGSKVKKIAWCYNIETRIVKIRVKS